MAEIPTTGRSRTESKFEEENVTTFVQSCVAFDANVTFGSLTDAKDRDPSETVLVLLQQGTQAQASRLFAESLSFWSECASSIIDAAPVGKLFGSFVQCPGGEGRARCVRLCVGVIPTTASRHNCALRPDVVTSFVTAVLGEGKVPLDRLDVFVATQNAELTYTSAIAKGSNRSFSAKARDWSASYMARTPKIRVYFPDMKARPESLHHVATSVQLCMRLVDAPTNLLDTTTFAEIATTYAQRLGYPTVFDIRGEALREQGFGGVYGVGKAAEFPPALIGLNYKPPEHNGITPKDKICMVGKGIVFDTGGLQMKQGPNMCRMKCDMGGAAAVFCSWLLAVRLQVPREVGCILCLADNACGPRAQRPDDIILLKSGLSVEINNTDAEGRLVLADGVYMAGSYKPDLIIDMATLTGAQGVATGNKHAAIFTNDDDWEHRMSVAGKKCGDLCFPVLYCPEFSNPEFSSKVADYRNSVRDRSNAQVSCAGQFIANNLASDYKGAFVHVDLAGPAFQNEAATGFGVTLMAQILAEGIV